MEGISPEGMDEQQLDMYWRGASVELINKHRVLVFSKTTCPYCVTVKDLFKSLGVEFFAYEFDQEGDDGLRMKKAMHQYTGKTSVPQVFIKGKHIGGCDDTMAAHGKGEIQKMLKD
ncbi:hypothetical protein JTE90_010898 [Oedothorax gibbosus]|uniref:Glutaredoxin domain-containing protein n=1 Tax=Oedothorax gibbosus TaxID=931172 RepID=A0AAV6UGB1_9ARAC|nr:hypothetical protein JTE90_010898 [Oedothorax gibbosus]